MNDNPHPIPGKHGPAAMVAVSGAVWIEEGATEEEAKARVLEAKEAREPDWDVGPWMRKLRRGEHPCQFVSQKSPEVSDNES